MKKSEAASGLVMQFTVTKVADGFEVDTHFAEGFDERALVDVFQAWAANQLSDEDKSPGWGKV